LLVLRLAVHTVSILRLFLPVSMYIVSMSLNTKIPLSFIDELWIYVRDAICPATSCRRHHQHGPHDCVRPMDSAIFFSRVSLPLIRISISLARFPAQVMNNGSFFITYSPSLSPRASRHVQSSSPTDGWTPTSELQMEPTT
jgi:hypothetical protein